MRVLDFDPTTLVLSDDIVSALFPKNCPAGESWKNEKNSGVKVHCNIPKGNLGNELATFSSDAEAIGCHVINYAKQTTFPNVCVTYGE